MTSPTRYRQRAERALGRKLQPNEHVHHHSEDQLVICDKAYHKWLHGVMRARGIPLPRPSWRKPTMLRVSPWALGELRRRAAEEGRTVVSVVDRVFGKPAVDGGLSLRDHGKRFREAPVVEKELRYDKDDV